MLTYTQEWKCDVCGHVEAKTSDHRMGDTIAYQRLPLGWSVLFDRTMACPKHNATIAQALDSEKIKSATDGQLLFVSNATNVLPLEPIPPPTNAFGGDVHPSGPVTVTAHDPAKQHMADAIGTYMSDEFLSKWRAALANMKPGEPLGPLAVGQHAAKECPLVRVTRIAQKVLGDRFLKAKSHPRDPSWIVVTTTDHYWFQTISPESDEDLEKDMRLYFQMNPPKGAEHSAMETTTGTALPGNLPEVNKDRKEWEALNEEAAFYRQRDIEAEDALLAESEGDALMQFFKRP